MATCHRARGMGRHVAYCIKGAFIKKITSLLEHCFARHIKEKKNEQNNIPKFFDLLYVWIQKILFFEISEFFAKYAVN